MLLRFHRREVDSISTRPMTGTRYSVIYTLPYVECAGDYLVSGVGLLYLLHGVADLFSLGGCLMRLQLCVTMAIALVLVCTSNSFAHEWLTEHGPPAVSASQTLNLEFVSSAPLSDPALLTLHHNANAHHRQSPASAPGACSSCQTTAQPLQLTRGHLRQHRFLGRLRSC
jgi:methionine-rich copper-binding protein CopC